MFQAVAPGDPNPDCPAEPNMPWMLILGGTGIGLLLLLRIAIVKCLRCIKNNQVCTMHGVPVNTNKWSRIFIFFPYQTCCDDVAGCFCEFGCNVMYDIMLMVAIVMWMVPVTWWVFRYVHQKSIHLLGEKSRNKHIFPTCFSDTELVLMPCTRWLGRSSWTISVQASETRTWSTSSSSQIPTPKIIATEPSTWSPLWYSLQDG